VHMNLLVLHDNYFLVDYYLDLYPDEKRKDEREKIMYANCLTRVD
jgi:hypothetical protein